MTVTSRNAGDLLTAALFNTKLEAPIVTSEINAQAVTTALLADGSVTAAKLAAQPAARAYHSVNQSLADSVDTVLALDSERFDTDAIHDPVTNNSRLTCRTAGKYLILAHVRFAPSGTGNRSAYIRLNGTTVLAHDRRTNTGATDATVLTLATLWDLAVNDYLELIARQTSGAALNVDANPAQSPELGMVRVSA